MFQGVLYADVQGEGIMFLFTDSQIVDEKMLVYVNDLLSSGEIPDLFAQEDKDEIINAVRSETKALGLVDTAENCWSTFIQKVSASPNMTALDTALRSTPSCMSGHETLVYVPNSL